MVKRGLDVRFRSRGVTTRTMTALVLGLAGAVMFLVALPPSMLLALAGGGLVATAWLIHKGGL